MNTDTRESIELVLQTKLHRPPMPVDLLLREDLIAQLDSARSLPLTLVSAPAGYGKSLLVASWLEQSDWPSIWLSLDADDGELRNLLNCVVVALRKDFAGVCEQTFNFLKAAELPSVNTLATVLGNELDAIERPFFLVLDDYHHLNANSAVHDLVERLLAHPPIPLHLVIITRLDPPLSLERQRAMGQMTDIRLLDLRLKLSDTRLLLQKSLGYEASDAALRNLDREIEGWMVGLKLVVIALRHAADPDELLTQFSGGTREMQAYLVSEVLAALPPALRSCLLRTAVLDRFCAPLCQALCAPTADADSGERDGAAFLRAAYGENLFLVPLDSRGEWYRYHHLFQELLQRELRSSLDTEAINALHLSASRWFEANELIDEAIRHALAAGEELEAVEIFERHRHAQLNADNWYVIERWLELLPVSRELRPDLLLARAWIAYERFDILALSDLVQPVLGLLDERAEGTVLWGELHFMQGVVHYWDGDGLASQDCFAVARPCLRPEHQLFLGLTNLLDGLSKHMCGDTQQAVAALSAQLGQASSVQSMYFTRLLSGLYFTYLMSGDLRSANFEAMRVESVASRGEIQYTVAWGAYMQGCALLHRYDLEQAAVHYADAVKDCYILHRIAAVESFAGLALCQQLLGNQTAARQTIERMLVFARELNDPLYLNIAQSCQARCDVLGGDPAKALAWAGQNRQPPEFAEMFMWMEVPALTRARVWIALGSDESLHLACGLLEEIVRRSRQWNLVNQRIEAQALRSLALEKLGRTAEALDCLVAALDQAAPGGWIRPFLELGVPMRDMLTRLEAGGKSSDFSRQVNSVFSLETRGQQAVAVARPELADRASELAEVLTRREITVLELLAQRLQNKEIAAKLCVSPETVKSYVKRLYQKLDVHNRRDAAAIGRRWIDSNTGE